MHYLNDIIIFFISGNNTLNITGLFMNSLNVSILRAKPVRFLFLIKIHYLGHMLVGEGIKPLPEKLDSKQELKETTKY